MNPFTIGITVFACVFAATLLGMRLRARLPEHHLNDETKDAVRIGMGLVATMAALMLGLLIASAKSSYDTEKSEVTQMATKITYLDRVLANYGPESRPARQALRRAVASAVRRIWPDTQADQEPTDPSTAWGEALPKAIQQLTTGDDAQRAFKSQAAEIAADLGQMRWLMFEQAGSSISTPLLVVVIAWLVIIFGSVGLFAPSNLTAVASLMLAAFSVAGAIFLILELDQPFSGLIRISSQPMSNALTQLAN